MNYALINRYQPSNIPPLSVLRITKAASNFPGDSINIPHVGISVQSVLLPEPHRTQDSSWITAHIFSESEDAEESTPNFLDSMLCEYTCVVMILAYNSQIYDIFMKLLFLFLKILQSQRS